MPAIASDGLHVLPRIWGLAAVIHIYICVYTEVLRAVHMLFCRISLCRSNCMRTVGYQEKEVVRMAAILQIFFITICGNQDRALCDVVDCLACATRAPRAQ